jgi:tetratricopeptide (TPR) repeat protein
MTNGLPQSIEQGARLIRRAQQIEAERAYSAVLKKNPNHFDALHRLGFVRYEEGRYADALKLIGKALKLNPRAADALSHYGMVLRKLGRHEEALAFYDKALAIKPDYADALNNRGNILLDLSRYEEALAWFDKALAIRPRYPEALNNRGNALVELERFPEALASYDQALKLNPHYAVALNNGGNALFKLKRYDLALASYDKALELHPDFPDALNNRGKALVELGRHEEALACYEQVLKLKPVDVFNIRGDALQAGKRFADALAAYDEALAVEPDSLNALLNRGNALQELDRFDEVLATFDKVLALDPNNWAAFTSRGNVLADLERPEEALASYDKALALKPDFRDAWFSRGLLLLRLGQFAPGWEGYEHRWDAASNSTRPARKIPEWTSESLEGRSILIYSEQGLGDSIQFVRYLDLVKDVAGRVTFFAPKQLVRLYKPFADRVELTTELSSEEGFDFRCALLSLPHRLKTELSNIPRAVPYLFAEEELVAKWRHRIGTEGFKIGICWQGNPAGNVDKGRSIPISKFLPLSQVPGVRLISLQKNYGLEQLERLPESMRVEILDEEFDSGPDAFIDTAAVMANLDLVVGSDTSVPHLAGALGRPTWLALQYLPFWVWMLDRSDSPWYPTMKLFRQSSRGDWDGVVARMVADLEVLLGSCRSV